MFATISKSVQQIQLLQAQGQLEQVQEMAVHLFPDVKKLKLIEEEVFLLLQLANIHLIEGDYQQFSAKLMEANEKSFQQRLVQNRPALLHFNALIYMMNKRYEKAIVKIEKAIQLASRNQQYDILSQLYVLLSKCTLQKEQPTQALQNAKLSVYFAKKVGHNHQEVRLHASMILVEMYIAMNQIEQAEMLILRLERTNNFYDFTRDYGILLYLKGKSLLQQRKFLEADLYLKDAEPHLYVSKSYYILSLIAEDIVNNLPEDYPANSYYQTIQQEVQQKMIPAKYVEALEHFELFEKLMEEIELFGDGDLLKGDAILQPFHDVMKQPCSKGPLYIVLFKFKLMNEQLWDEQPMIIRQMYLQLEQNLQRLFQKHSFGMYYPTEYCLLLEENAAINVATIYEELVRQIKLVTDLPQYHHCQMLVKVAAKRVTETSEALDFEQLYADVDSILYYAEYGKDVLVIAQQEDETC